jgi:predicted Zn-dependent protease
VLGGGDAAGVDELAAPIERGIYVTRLWYVNTVREKELLLTGMTRDGTFLIEDGRIAAPLRDVRFTDSVLRLLGATEALTARQRLVTEGDFYGRRSAQGVLCPALRADGFRVTGVTTS